MNKVEVTSLGGVQEKRAEHSISKGVGGKTDAAAEGSPEHSV